MDAGPSKVFGTMRCIMNNYAPIKFGDSFSDTLVGESLMYVQGIFPKDQRVISLYMIFELPGVHRCVWEIEKELFI